jgi:xanthine dehydrogenase accessory factor
MRDVLPDLEQWLASGERVGRAVVTSVWGSAPRPEGAVMLGTASGRMAGSVSGGCVETATAQEIGEAIRRGTPGLVTFGVSHERAWEVGLACGGTIKVFVEPSVRAAVLEAARGPGGAVVATVVEGGALVGRSAVLGETNSGDEWLVEAVGVQAGEALRRESSHTVEVTAPDGTQASVFLEVFPRRPTLVIFGGVHIAMALVPLAKALGYRAIVADGRESFLTRDRFPDADELILEWPQRAFDRIGIDRATYVCLLSHDPKFDEPALEIALRSPAVYIGAIGSRKTQADRRARLAAAGFSAQDIARIHGPIGLDLGGRAPAEVALAILAEMTAVRYAKADVPR